MKKNLIRYKVAKTTLRLQNSAFAESCRKFDMENPKAIPTIGTTMLCIGGILITMLIIGSIC